MELGPGRQSLRHRIANAAAKRVHQVFFGMAIGRKINPLPAASLPLVIEKRVLQVAASRVDLQVAGLREGSRSYRARLKPGAEATSR